MTDSLLKAAHYGDRENKAVLMVLTELAQVLGSQSGSFVLVGGLVPGLLYENADPKHVGTLDIDINLNTDALAEYDYGASMSATDERVRSENSFRKYCR